MEGIEIKTQNHFKEEGGWEMKITRRQFLKTTGKGALVAGAAMALPLKFGVRPALAAANSPQLAKWQ